LGTSNLLSPQYADEGVEAAITDCATLMQTMNSIGGWENVLLNQTIPTLKQSLNALRQQLAYVNQQISPTGIPAQIATLEQEIQTVQQDLASNDPQTRAEGLFLSSFWLPFGESMLKSLKSTLATDQELALPKSIASLEARAVLIFKLAERGFCAVIVGCVTVDKIKRLYNAACCVRDEPMRTTL